MKIIIVGLGAIGQALIQNISKEGHDIAVIDSDSLIIEEITNKYDVAGITGNGACASVLRKAGADMADIVIAVTSSEEVNMMCCACAKKSGTKHTIARISAPEFNENSNFFQETFGIDLILNPPLETAYKISRLLRFPPVLKIEAFAGGQVDIAEVCVSKNHKLSGLALKDLHSVYETTVLVSLARRGDKLIIPRGDFVICEGDILSLTAPISVLSTFFEKTGVIGKPIKSVIIAGCGDIGYYLLQHLKNFKGNFSIIDFDKERCLSISNKYPSARVILGNAVDSQVLTDEIMKHIDACVCLTGSDESNIMFSIFAASNKISKIITKLSLPIYNKVIKAVGLENVILPQESAVESVLRYIRGITSKKHNSSVRALYKLADGAAEALEFYVDRDFKYVDIQFKDPRFRLKPDVLIASVIRKGCIINPVGSASLHPGDIVVVISTDKTFADLTDIFY